MIDVIILNGPPGVGKDTIANALIEQGESIIHLRFKEQLYSEAFELFSSYYSKYREDCIPLTYGKFTELCSDRVAKETPHAALCGLTPRQALIHTSENVVKPALGVDHYGVVAALSAELALALYKTVVFSDGGFIDELEPVCDRFNVLLVRLHRDGYTFKGDSRSYVESDLLDKVIDIHLEEGNVQFAVDEIMAAAQ